MEMRKPVVLLASMASAVLLACMAAALTAVPGAGQPRTVTLVGAGDIADCDTRADSATAKLLGRIPGTVFTLGDNAYPHGTAAQFRNCYDPTWGRFKKRTKPTAGNRDYDTTGAKPYFNYFGAQAGKPGRGYYSYDRGTWHIVALNSNCGEVGGCGSQSPQGRWLRSNLANHRSRCTLAYFHHPLFSSGQNGNHTEMRPTWQTLYAANADVVVNGHDHSYERFAPQRPDGTYARHKGIRQFVVGTGGASLSRFGTVKRNSQVRNATTHGVLKLTLKPRSYAWKFVPVAGKTFTDSGTTRCH
jgi:acid phosphatase type 7